MQSSQHGDLREGGMSRAGILAGVAVLIAAGTIFGLVMRRPAVAPESAGSVDVPGRLPPTVATEVQPLPETLLAAPGSPAQEVVANAPQSGGGSASTPATRPVSDSFRAWSALAFLPEMAELSGAAYVRSATGADDAGVARMMAVANKMLRADVQFRAQATAALCKRPIASPEELVAALTRMDLDVEESQERLADGALSELGPDLAGKVAALAARQGPYTVSGTDWTEWLAAEKRSLPEILYGLCKG
jgi:hypothetical protein